jgi:hypothetical protein
MDIIAGVLILVVIVIAFEGKDWIATYWKGKAEAAREDRLAAEAKTELARINAESNRTTHP